MASQTQGIQQLLQAEKRAAEKVAEARKRKPRFLFSEDALGSQGNLSAEVEAQTRKKLQAMQGGQARGKDRVLRQLLTIVWDVRPQIHPNYRAAI
ncbi:hypothetical protein JD844_013554 [Phrynosoma platyrhinos]|uniref:V-type proton ATPase subunit G n=1 Tax=Phrynosoma platyrhinos TaxID=52577 RepID=A0ABQ7TL29_PHRPL|nr:hypothetical protein JD844_013554 [Phrynosoma platyrhinos]